MIDPSSDDIRAVCKGIRADQKLWAEANGIPHDKGYTATIDQNLFQDLSEEARKEFAAGKGDELETKLRALHSSAALACNIFDYWKGQADRSPLAQALGVEGEIACIAFECIFPTRLPGTPPHLDATLTVDGGRLLAVESKFSESYCGSRNSIPFKPSYFKSGRDLWIERGLPRCQALAEARRDDHPDYRFRILDAPQLLKHILGLAVSAEKPFELMYLWFDPGGTVGWAHAAEVQRFLREVDDGVVRACSHQELIERLARVCGREHNAYVEYLQERYGRGSSLRGPPA